MATRTRVVRVTGARRWLVAGVGAAVALALAAGWLTGAPSAHADVTTGLVLEYRLDEFAGNVAYDSSGNNRNGTVNGTVSWGGQEGLAFNGSNTYIKMPNNIMSGLNSITVAFDVWIDPTMGKPYFLYGLGNSSGTSGNGYLFSTGNQFRTGVTLSDFHSEQQTRPGTSYQLARGLWKHVTYTQTGSTGILYENGVEKARNTSITITPGAIGGGTTVANYIGRSLYSTDLYFKGRMRDFRIYDRALAANEVAEVATKKEVQWEQLDALAAENGALALWQSDTGIAGGTGAWMRFPADFPAAKMCSGCLVHPTGWVSEFGVAPTEWPEPDVMDRSQFTVAQLTDIEDAVTNKVQPSGDTTYQLDVKYVGTNDQVVAKTDAPASVTDPLVTTYGTKLDVEPYPTGTSYEADDPPAATCAADKMTAGVVLTLPAAPAAGVNGAESVNDALTKLQWQQLQAQRNYNCALDAFQDPNTGPVLIFPSDQADISAVANPSGWISENGQAPTSWPRPTTARSQFTVDQIVDIQGAVERKIEGQDENATTYNLNVVYDGVSDRIVAYTDAPSTVTDPLPASYPNKVVIKALP